MFKQATLFWFKVKYQRQKHAEMQELTATGSWWTERVCETGGTIAGPRYSERMCEHCLHSLHFPWARNTGLWVFLLLFLIAEVILRKISLPENSIKSSGEGESKVGLSDLKIFFFRCELQYFLREGCRLWRGWGRFKRLLSSGSC